MARDGLADPPDAVAAQQLPNGEVCRRRPPVSRGKRFLKSRLGREVTPYGGGTGGV